MTTAVHVPLNTYLRTLDYEPDCEYVDGVIEERPIGEWDHTSWQYAIQQWFAQHVKQWNIYVRAEQRVQVNTSRFRVPDICVIARSLSIERIVTRPPIAVFEVLSPEDRMPRVLIKLKDYELMGIPTIMLIDPQTQTISRFVEGKLEAVTEEIQALPGGVYLIDWRRVREFLD